MRVCSFLPRDNGVVALANFHHRSLLIAAPPPSLSLFSPAPPSSLPLSLFAGAALLLPSPPTIISSPELASLGWKRIWTTHAHESLLCSSMQQRHRCSRSTSITVRCSLRPLILPSLSSLVPLSSFPSSSVPPSSFPLPPPSSRPSSPASLSPSSPASPTSSPPALPPCIHLRLQPSLPRCLLPSLPPAPTSPPCIRLSLPSFLLPSIASPPSSALPHHLQLPPPSSALPRHLQLPPPSSASPPTFGPCLVAFTAARALTCPLCAAIFLSLRRR